MEKRVDLHVHTYYSDGTFSPEEVLREAKRSGLSCIAICDHDCTDGIEDAASISDKYGVEVIPGVEITSEKEGLEIHILGYFIDVETRPLVKLLRDLRDSRVKRIYKLIENLNNYKIDISPEAVFKLSKEGSIGRLHLATALYNEGLVSSVKEAFNKYIGDGKPCYLRRFNKSPEETIDVILKSGGVPVYAHPKVMGRDDFIPAFMKAGLRGIEAYHADHSKEAFQHYSNLAQKYGLLVTGGSDCHGLGKSKVLMGKVTMPYSCVEELRKEAEEIRDKSEYRNPKFETKSNDQNSNDRN